MEAQLAAEAAARVAAMESAKTAASTAQLLQAQVDELNAKAADATRRLQESLTAMEQNRSVSSPRHCPDPNFAAYSMYDVRVRIHAEVDG